MGAEIATQVSRRYHLPPPPRPRNFSVESRPSHAGESTFGRPLARGADSVISKDTAVNKQYRSKSRVERFRVRPALEALEERVLLRGMRSWRRINCPAIPQSRVRNVVGSGLTIPQGLCDQYQSVNQNRAKRVPSHSRSMRDPTLALYRASIFIGWDIMPGWGPAGSLQDPVIARRNGSRRIHSPSGRPRGLSTPGNWSVSRILQKLPDGEPRILRPVDARRKRDWRVGILHRQDDDGHSETSGSKPPDTTLVAYNDRGVLVSTPVLPSGRIRAGRTRSVTTGRFRRGQARTAGVTSSSVRVSDGSLASKPTVTTSVISRSRCRSLWCRKSPNTKVISRLVTTSTGPETCSVPMSKLARDAARSTSRPSVPVEGLLENAVGTEHRCFANPLPNPGLLQGNDRGGQD